MAESRQRESWWHTAALIATIHNTFASKGKTWTAADCHPMESQKPKVTLKGKQLSILKDVFCPESKK